MLSQCSPERVSKKCQTNVIFFIAFGSQKESKMESNRQQSRSGESPGAQGVFERLRVASGAPFCDFLNYVLYICRCVGVFFLHLSPDSLGGKLCFCFTLVSSLLFALFTLFRSHSQRRFLVPLPLQVYIYIYIYIPESAAHSGSWRFLHRGFPLGIEVEGESPRGGGKEPA